MLLARLEAKMVQGMVQLALQIQVMVGDAAVGMEV
jgi:hypothetical protein